ncbi:MAG: FtsX-like permease family protein [Actinomycetota bacterium]|nr:FtsX-like permease family protein [Actinomycetota bacterium]
MIPSFVGRTLRRSPRRVLVGLVGVALPVALFAGTAFFVDTATRTMTAHALVPVQVDMQVLAKTAGVDMAAVDARLARLRNVRSVERFAQVDLPVVVPGAPGPRQLRVFAVDPAYLTGHPWVNLTGGRLAGGVLVADPLANATTGEPGARAQISIPGAPVVDLPVTGTVDLRKADTWFAVTAGDNQGDVHFVPGSIVVDYALFEQRLLPALRQQALAGSDAAAADAPGVLSLQAHVGIDRGVFAADPAVALTRSTGLRRTLERSSPGQISALDNLGDALGAAKGDAVNAKILFLFLGIPGVLVAGGLAVATAVALAAAQRREVALLRLRGATARQISRLSAATAVSVGLVGSVVGLGLGALAVTALLGSTIWRGAAASSVITSAVLAVLVGLVVTVAGLRTTSRAAARASVIDQRRQLDLTWRPGWRRLRLDLWAIGVGLAVLAVNAGTGGFRRTSVDGATLAATFYLLLAPIALWVGVTLLGVRTLAALLGRSTRPERARPLGSWGGAAMRWLGRRPSRTASTVVIGALAVAFGTNLLAFVHTYDAAKRSEAAVSVGADIRVTPAQLPTSPVPPLTARDVASSTPVRVVTLTTGTDKRTAYAVDPATYAATVAAQTPVMVATTRTAGLGALLRTRDGILISKAYARDFAVAVGDPVPATVPDAAGKPVQLMLKAVGIFATVAPTVPGADVVMNAAALPPGLVSAPDFYLARAVPGQSVDRLAARIGAAAGPGQLWTVTTFRTALAKEQNTLATLNLAGLGKLETAGAVLIAALGIAVLGAFLVLERRREYAVMRSLGATTRQVLVPPALEGVVTVAASVLIGVPVGIGMAMISVRVLNPLFTLRPPLIRIDGFGLAALVAGVLVATALALLTSLITVARLRTVSVLRES